MNTDSLRRVKDYFTPITYMFPYYRHAIRGQRDMYNPFFIIGSGRSGNTLMRRGIIQAKGIHIPPETYVLVNLIRLFLQNKGLKWKNLVTLLMATIEYHPEFYTFDVPNLIPLASKLMKLPNESKNLAAVIDSFYKYHAECLGIECVRWGDKTPLNTLRLSYLDMVFPSAQYIWMVRNGYDVVHSFVKAGIYKNYTDAAKRWEVSNLKALSFYKRNPSRTIVVKYEHLVNNPDLAYADVFSFLNLDFKGKYLSAPQGYMKRMGDVEKKAHHHNVTKTITNASVGKGLSEIPEEELRKIKKIVDSTNILLGYR